MRLHTTGRFGSILGVFGLVFISLFFQECEGPTATPEGTILLQDQHTEAVLIETEPILLENCYGTGTASRQAERTHTTTTVVEFTGSVGTPALLEAITLQLEFELRFQQGETQTAHEAFAVEVEGGQQALYSIEWYETWLVGNAYVPWLDLTIPYRVRTGISSEAHSSPQEPCPADSTGEESTLLPGYLPYDDFSSGAVLSSRWSLNDEYGLCDLVVQDGRLVFDCTNHNAEDVGASLHNTTDSLGTTGVIALVRVERSGGPFQLATQWRDPSGVAPQRTYHLQLGVDYAEAVEFFPDDPVEPWRAVILGQMPVMPGEAHLLQIEHTTGGINFLVDGQPLPLDMAPEWVESFVMVDWGIPFFVWPEHSIQGWIDYVGVCR
ncbi:MAG: hypothetical protein JW910_14020 [Anaerolineae bacterium]|nr:hypothetical protein [Anaerolineae bacterium]